MSSGAACPTAFFLNPGQGFHATLKEIPEHFVVDEVSSFSGNPLVKNLKRKAESAEITLELKRTKIETASSDLDSNASNTDSSTTGNFRCDVEWCKKRLSEILTISVHSNLGILAKNTFAEDAEKEPLVLGTFSLRDERVMLHRSLRYAFPQLKTVTSPRTAVVSAHPCPNYKKFSDIIGQDKTDKLLRFIVVECAANLKEEVSIEGNFSKEARRKVHHLIATCYGKFMEAKTIPLGDKSHKITARPRRKKEEIFSEAITAFTLWKRNTETHAAVQQLASHLQLRPHLINFAGNKDKRAITTQTCTVCGISQNRFERRCQTLPKHLRVSDVRPVSRVVRLGELDGNRFRIRLTNLHLPNSQDKSQGHLQDIVNLAIENIKKGGFVNYFGPQRFGRRVSDGKPGGSSPDLEAPAIGLAILNCDFKQAVNVMLSPTGSASSPEPSDADKAKIHFQTTGDIEGTLGLMPQHKLRELSVLRTLRRHGTADRDAFVKALLSLTHSARLLYVHSYCSWVWNKIATARMRRHGRKPVPGDLAILREDGTQTSTERPHLKKNASKEKVYVVTEDDVTSRRVQLKDVVLAVPGHQIRYSPNMDEEYRDLLRELNCDDSGTSMFRVAELKLKAPGAYRRLVEFPRNLSHTFLPPFTRLAETRGQRAERESRDENRFEEAESRTESSGLPNKPDDSKTSEKFEVLNPVREVVVDHSNSNEPSDDFSTTARDVELIFELPPSCYATTMLQELTKGHLG